LSPAAIIETCQPSAGSANVAGSGVGVVGQVVKLNVMPSFQK
jgi:hypothetical protein